jgi:hypothetical protein
MDKCPIRYPILLFNSCIGSIEHNILFLAGQTASDIKEKTVEEALEEIRKIREKNKEIYREMGEIG